MNLNKPLELSVYWLTPEAAEAERLGLEHNEDSVLRSITFYMVDHIVVYPELINNKPASRIYSGGNDYLVNMGYESLKTLISENLRSSK